MQPVDPLSHIAPRGSDWLKSPDGASLVSAVVFVAVAVVAGAILREHLSPSSMPMLFLLAVLVASLRAGFWAGILASILAFLAENFFFLEPYFTFHVAHLADWLSLIVLLIVGAITGFLVGRLREEAETARLRAFALEVMGEHADAITDCHDRKEAGRILVHNLARLVQGGAVLFLEKEGALGESICSPPDLTLDPTDLDAVERCYRRGTTNEPAAPGWAGGRFVFEAMRGVGVVGYGAGDMANPAGKPIREARRTLIEQALLAFERIALAADAAEARESAEREALRAALLSSLSHDLRTPLATIMGGVSALRELGASMPDQARIDTLLAVEEEASRLSRYVANLLHMTRLRAGLDLRLDWIDAADAARAAVARGRRAWPRSILDLDTGGEIPILRSDAVLLEQALFNLIDNACKFSGEGGRVSVILHAANESISFKVVDQGPGIPAAEQERIFDPFFRGQSAGQGGAGLGLSIVRGIVQALGGSVRVESPASPAGGTAMHILLPKEPPA